MGRGSDGGQVGIYRTVRGVGEARLTTSVLSFLLFSPEILYLACVCV